MSLVPLLFSDWWNELERPHRLTDQNFGLGLYNDQLVSPSYLEQYVVPRIQRAERRLPTMYLRPWADLLRQGEGGASIVENNRDQFQVQLDVQQFKPDEINVKVQDNFVVVEGKHEEKRDEHGYISRQFTRKYLIPEQCDLDQVKTTLSSDGVLMITAPRKKELKDKNERNIKIEHTGKPAIREKESKKEEKKGEKSEQK